jgi:hypothetical protein
VTWKTLKDGLVLLVDSELLIVDAQLYSAILAALPCCTGGGLVEGLANAVWAGPVSALRWVLLSAYAADGKPATCSKELAVQWIWGIVRSGRGDFIRTR